MTLHCPHCGNRMICPCRDCEPGRRRAFPDTQPWEYLEGYAIRCAQCGMAQSARWWNAIITSIEDWGLAAALHPIPRDKTKEILKTIATPHMEV